MELKNCPFCGREVVMNGCADLKGGPYYYVACECGGNMMGAETKEEAAAKWNRRVEGLPSAQPEPLSDAYMKAVWTWLLDYQIKVAKLKGRYTPYEVLSWVANDWRKEHE